MRQYSMLRDLIGQTALIAVLLSSTLFLVACGEQITPVDQETVSLFNDVTVHFTPGDSTLYDSPLASAKDNGRIMSTYREMAVRPGFRITMRLTVSPICNVIRNMVDRWDRAGHIALIKPGQHKVEMVRFMTAYGGTISHEVDVTHLAPLLTEYCEFEVFIDTWVSVKTPIH